MDVAEPEEQMARLASEWEQIYAARREQALGAWTTAMAALRQEEAELRAAGKWVRGPTDVFGVLGISRAEVRHTRFIAWLLDPAAQHGLGAVLLQRTLERAFPDDPFRDLEGARTFCEVTRGECRIDVLVEAPGLVVVIEAKVDAAEGPAQCDYQFEQFSGDVGARFVFLTPRGRPPRTATGDAAEAFRTLSFAAIRDDLRAALASRGPAPGRGAAEDYLRTLEREFPWPA